MKSGIKYLKPDQITNVKWFLKKWANTQWEIISTLIITHPAKYACLHTRLNQPSNHHLHTDTHTLLSLSFTYTHARGHAHALTQVRDSCWCELTTMSTGFIKWPTQSITIKISQQIKCKQSIECPTGNSKRLYSSAVPEVKSKWRCGSRSHGRSAHELSRTRNCTWTSLELTDRRGGYSWYRPPEGRQLHERTGSKSGRKFRGLPKARDKSERCFPRY